MSDPTPRHEALPLIEALLDGTIDDAGFARLDELLCEDPGARKLYRTLANLHAALPGIVGNTPRVSIHIADDASDTLLKPDELPNADLMSLLLQAEETGRDIDPMAMARQRFAGETISNKTATLSLNDWLQAGRYLLRHSLTPKRVATLAAASLFALLATVLFLAWPSDPAIQRTAEQSDDITKPAPARAVAMLTAELNAQWSTPSGTLSPNIGDALRVGQRLSLTEGFAEITTNRGAVTTLEAPAIIELLDHNNALRLHTGKLVGICETATSKGFLVRTPHMDVTDLGTAFGVEVDGNSQDTQVHVLTGEVRVSANRSDADPRFLLAGQAVVANSFAGITDVAYDQHRFVPDMATAALKPDFGDTNAVWLGQVSGDLSQGKRRADALQVFIEQRGLLLERAVPTDFKRENPWDPAKANTRYEVPAGEKFDVYLLHFDLLSGHQQTEAFMLDFDRPIVGVIISQELLDATDETFGVPGVTYPVFNIIPEILMGGQRGLNYRMNVTDIDGATLTLTNDVATISADGTQLNLRLWGGEDPDTAKMDQVRVLVRAQETEN